MIQLISKLVASFSLKQLKHQYENIRIYYIQSNELKENIDAYFKKAIFHSRENIKKLYFHCSENISCSSRMNLDVLCFVH